MLRLPPDPDLPLRSRFLRLQDELSTRDLVRWGVGLARGTIPARSSTHPPIEWIGGTADWAPYWSRVWGLRLLLHLPLSDSPTTIEDGALAAVLTDALDDEAWRVREMALKVAVHQGASLDVDRVVALLDDPVARVRRQAARLLDLRAP